MLTREQIDPFGVGFFADESLELEERVGLALIEGARHIDLTFGTQILPYAKPGMSHGGASFQYSAGITYDFTKTEEMLRKFPEHEEFIREYARKFESYYAETDPAQSGNEKGWTLTWANAAWGGDWGGHSNPDFGRIIELGTEGIRELIAKGRQEHPEADWFYNGCSYAMDALDILGDRFCALANEKASQCIDPADRQRYLQAAKAFEVVPRRPAYDFTSACHVFWLMITFDGVDSVDSPGRFDQYMWKTYEKAIRGMDCERQEAADMLERLWEAFHETRTWNLCLSGSDENWVDQTNQLTYDILKLAARKKYQTPNITLRVHRNTPQKLWEAIYETLSSGIGMPALYNDEVVCPALEKIGIPPCHSHLYCMNGCNQIDIMGKSHMGLEDGEVVFGKCLEYALHNGVNAITGEFNTIPTGDARRFTTYEELERAVLRQLEYVTFQVCLKANASQHTRGIYRVNPYRSCLIEGCLEKGKDYRNGGPLYGHGQVLGEAIADTGDSLWAVKKLVFLEKKYTMSQLMDALEADFVGYEELRRDFAACEKFGNDFEEVDQITAKILNRFFTVLKRHHTYRGGIYTGGCSPFSRAANYGRSLAALPNGRKNGDPLIADCIGAVPGGDVQGPTALIKSVLKYNHEDSCSGFIFHVKFDKKLFATPQGKEAFLVLAKTYFAQGGQQYTVTVVSQEELLDAKIHPELHRDLIVRVGGYSEYFVNLEPGLQDNVISRNYTEV